MIVEDVSNDLETDIVRMAGQDAVMPHVTCVHHTCAQMQTM